MDQQENNAFDQGRFQGQVLARLDSIVGSIAEINVVFLKHSDADKAAFDDVNKRIDDLEKIRWIVWGGVIVTGIVWQFVGPRIATLIHLSN